MVKPTDDPSLPHGIARFRLRTPEGKMWLILAVLGLIGSAGFAQDAAEAGVLREPAHYWALGESEKGNPQKLQMEFTITYYDPLWSLLWGDKDGAGFFLPIHGRALPMRSGQRVRLEGSVVPSQGFPTDNIEVTVLADDQWPVPEPLNGRMAEIDRLDTRRTTLEGLVFSQREVGPTHLQLQVQVEGRLANVHILTGENAPVPQLVGAQMKFKGVCVLVRDAEGKQSRIDYWVPRLVDAEVTGWLADDPRFQLPRTPIERLGAETKAYWLLVEGEIIAQEAGKSLTIRDETGQVTVQTIQAGFLPSAGRVRMVGRPERQAGHWTLRDPVCQAVGAPARTGGQVSPGLVKLRLADQILSLNPAEADLHQPVGLRGVVTWADSNSPFFYLQDVSGGVCVYHHLDPSRVPLIGYELIVTGSTFRDEYAPAVNLTGSAVQGLLVLPSARYLTLEQALSGTQEGRLVEMRGYVYQVEAKGDRTLLHLTSAAGNFLAEVPGEGSLAGLQGTVVRLKGVCRATTNDHRELAGIKILMPNRDAITVETEAAAVVAGPSQQIAGLRQFSGQQAFTRLVHLHGIVLLHQPGQYLYLQDETGGVKVLTREGGAWEPGTHVEVAGFPELVGSRVVVREAVIRAAAADGLKKLESRPIPGDIGINLLNEGRLVRVEATLRQSTAEGTSHRLSLQAGEVSFDARLHWAKGWESPAPDSLLSLSGVYVIEFDEHHHPRRFALELRQPGDIVVLEAPPWWNVRRAITLAGIITCGALLVIAWVVSLRRRVREQTEQIKREHEKQARLQAELERTLRLESLGLLASGIAQEFNAQLTTILSNLGLAAMDKRVTDAAGDCVAEAERGARRVRDLTQQLQTFARGGDPLRVAVQLPDVVTEAANFARYNTGIALDFRIPADLPPAYADAGQISRVVHNLVTYAIQAQPAGGVINLALANVTAGPDEKETLALGRYIQLSLDFAGPSFTPEALAGIFDPYHATEGGSGGMGVATARAILKKHDGHIEASARQPTGLVFRLWLPVAEGNKPAAPARNHAHSPQHVLVFLAEAAELSSLSRLLGLAGHEVTGVVSTTEAIDANARATEAGRGFDWVIVEVTSRGGSAASQLLAELRRVNPRLKAIAVTGRQDEHAGREPATEGFQVTAAKPFDIPELVRIIG